MFFRNLLHSKTSQSQTHGSSFLFYLGFASLIFRDAIERNKLLIPKASVQAQVGPVVDSINVVLSKLFRVLLVEDNMQSLKALGYLFVVSILGSLFTLPALCLYGKQSAIVAVSLMCLNWIMHRRRALVYCAQALSVSPG